MREFRLIFAQFDSSEIIRPDIAEKLGRKLAISFGGFTRTDAIGGYVMNDGEVVIEPVYIFDVATDLGAGHVLDYARMTAREVCRELDQESIYFRNVDGMVRLLA